MYDSGAGSHYISEQDHCKARLPSLRCLTKKVGVANGMVCHGDKITHLPIPQLDSKTTEANTTNNFPSSLMSVEKTADTGTISIFTKDGVTIHNEKGVLITCKNKSIHIGACDNNGHYCIPLIQHHSQWQPQKPSKKARRILRQANSIYDLPTTEQSIKWMRAVCGYPVKSTRASTELGRIMQLSTGGPAPSSVLAHRSIVLRFF